MTDIYMTSKLKAWQDNKAARNAKSTIFNHRAAAAAAAASTVLRPSNHRISRTKSARSVRVGAYPPPRRYTTAPQLFSRVASKSKWLKSRLPVRPKLKSERQLSGTYLVSPMEAAKENGGGGEQRGEAVADTRRSLPPLIFLPATAAAPPESSGGHAANATITIERSPPRRSKIPEPAAVAGGDVVVAREKQTRRAIAEGRHGGGAASSNFHADALPRISDEDAATDLTARSDDAGRGDAAGPRDNTAVNRTYRASCAETAAPPTAPAASVPQGAPQLDVPISEAVVTMESCMRRLRPATAERMRTPEYLEAVTTVMNFTSHRYALCVEFVRALADAGYVPWFAEAWTEMHKVADLYNDAYLLTFLKKAKAVLWNSSDKSKQICRSIGESGVISLLLGDLQDPYLAVGQLQANVNRSYLMKGSLGILHNSIRNWADNRRVFRAAGAVGQLQGYLICTNLMVKSKALLILAYIVDESESDMLNTSDKNIKFILKILQNGINTPNHVAPQYMFSCAETLQGLNHITSNDANKQALVRADAVSLYSQLLLPNCSELEQTLAAKGLWLLAFNDEGKQAIHNSPTCIESLKRLRRSGSAAVRNAAAGALWIIEDRDDAEPESYVMISYDWSVQPTVLRLRDMLTATGYKVWLDVDNMSGDILDSMALAVENATAILVCMTQKYKESPSCRTEAEYARKLQKPIIPLRMVADYVPDGWLGLIVGTLLYFNFSHEIEIESEFTRLCRELKQQGGGRGRRGAGARRPSTMELVKSHMAHTDGSGQLSIYDHMSASTTFKDWSTEEVVMWLRECELQDLVKGFADIDGGLLQELQLMCRSAPESYYTCISTDLGITNLPTRLRFTRALRKLSA